MAPSFRPARRPLEDLTGRKFGRLTVIGFSQRVRVRGVAIVFWKCACRCGTDVLKTRDSLVFKKHKSCGCLPREQASRRMKERHKLKARSSRASR